MSEALRFNAPSWPEDAAPLRACVKCDYGRDLATAPADVGVLCRHPEVARLPRLKLTDVARKHGMACGPEARYLTIGGVLL